MLVEMLTALTPWNNKINKDSCQFSMMFVASAPIICLFVVCLFISMRVLKRMALIVHLQHSCMISHCRVFEVQ